MSRVSVWVEAYEEYLISKHIAARAETTKMSDDELIAYYNKMVDEKNLWEDAIKFVHQWCMTFK